MTNSHVCDHCNSDAVAIADCHPHVEDDWTVLLRCGECGSWRDSIISLTELRALENKLLTGWHAIERELETFAHQCMLEDVETFVTALRRDLIDADDFALDRS